MVKTHKGPSTTYTNWKMISKRHLIDHMNVHKDNKNVYSYYNFEVTNNRERCKKTCILCNAMFRHQTALNDHILRKHPEFIALVTGKIHKCTMCTFQTTITTRLKLHLFKHPETAADLLKTCSYCNASFKRKNHLDEHLIRKHPNFVSSVTSKIHECKRCTYKTTHKSNFRRHFMVNHSEVADNRTFVKCTHCNKTFKRKLTLDDHVLKRHPDFIASVSSKIHDCTKSKRHLIDHMNVHKDNKNVYSYYDFEATNNRERCKKTCILCNAMFRHQTALNDHILRKHPEFIGLVTGKIHKCTMCTFQTTITTRLKLHLFKHPETAADLLKRCSYCNASFKRKIHLDEHLIRKHPNFVSSVTSKIHECKRCTYKTTHKSNFRRHFMVNHSEVADNRTFVKCTHCNKTFKRKLTLDDHVLKRHPDFIASVSSKIHDCTKSKRHLIDHMNVHKNSKSIYNRYNRDFRTNSRILFTALTLSSEKFIASVTGKIHKCTMCTFKTAITSSLKLHLSKHPETAADLLKTCLYCNASFRQKNALDGHIIKRHPNCVSSVTSKIHECTQCTYKTTNTSYFNKHLTIKHVKRHPDFMASVSNKIHECKKCSYKTISIRDLNRHMLKPLHKNSKSIYNYYNCDFRTNSRISFTALNKTLSSESALDEHIIRKHPNCISSVTSKIHECIQCTYKTTKNSYFRRHLTAKHGKRIFSRCIYCSKTFTRKIELDEHIVKRHPDFLESVSCKVYACTKCTFKTTLVDRLNTHMLRHPEIAASVSSTVHGCTKCTFKTVHPSCLKRHVDFRGYSFACYNCEHTASNKLHLIGHMKVHENRKNTYNCHYCDFRTNFRRLLSTHITTHDSSCTPFQQIYIKEENAKRATSKLDTPSKSGGSCIHCNAIFKQKRNLQEHIVQNHPEFITSVTRKIHECTRCHFKTTISNRLQEHLLKHTETADERLERNAITRKILACTKCPYKTTFRRGFQRHLLKHPEIAVNYRFNTCVHCNTTFRTEDSRNEHIIKKHPRHIPSITRKIHACANCSFKTTISRKFQTHLLMHPETASEYGFRTCAHCDTEFKNRYLLYEHILNVHPKLIGSITWKIHSCSKCAFKTSIGRNFQRHLMKHPETVVDYKFSSCTHCSESFKTKQALDNHVIKNHPSSVHSVTYKIHKCTKCDYTTTINTHFKRHQLKHIETNRNKCVHCDKSCLSKASLDDHVVKEHPNFIHSVTSKIRECTKCSYKTTMAGDLMKHMIQHPDVAGNDMFNTCVYCNKSYALKRSLNEHIVKTHPDCIASVSCKIFKCTRCDFSTTINTHFKRHQLKHSDAIINHNP
nr:unnamed protein product [Callosobruchus analis]